MKKRMRTKTEDIVESISDAIKEPIIGFGRPRISNCTCEDIVQEAGAIEKQEEDNAVF